MAVWTWITQPLLLCNQWGPGEHWQPGHTAAAKLSQGSLCLPLSAVHLHADPEETLVPGSAFAASHVSCLTAGNGSHHESFMQRGLCLGSLKRVLLTETHACIPSALSNERIHMASR